MKKATTRLIRVAASSLSKELQVKEAITRLFLPMLKTAMTRDEVPVRDL